MIIRNSRGITLIALIVTIIVLVLIAGVTMTALTSDNGILRQTNTAKVEQIEATAREQVKLAVSAMRLAIAEAGARDNSYKASENVGKIQAKLVEILNADKSGLNGEFGYGENDLADDAAGTELKVNYTGDDYKNACNDTNADIVYTITLGQKTIEITYETNATLKYQGQNDVFIDVGINNEIAYLVDKVKIGDYVDIGIEYTNTEEYTSGYTTSTHELTGWRVLSTSGSGDTGTVMLVSAGTPLSYYHSKSSNTPTLENLSKLNKTLPQGNNNTIGFTSSGFANGTMNLADIWSLNSNINASTAHAITENEVEVLYKEFTGIETTIPKLQTGMEPFPLTTSKMKETAINLGNNINSHAEDLISIGISYWLGGKGNTTYRLYGVGYSGSVYLGYSWTKGIRICISLNHGIVVNIGNKEIDGSTKEKAYVVR